MNQMLTNESLWLKFKTVIQVGPKLQLLHQSEKTMIMLCNLPYSLGKE